MNEKWGEIQGKLDLARVRGEFELSEFEISRFYSTNKSLKKKKSEINCANIFCWKIKAEDLFFNGRLSWYSIGNAMQRDW